MEYEKDKDYGYRTPARGPDGHVAAPAHYTGGDDDVFGDEENADVRSLYSNEIVSKTNMTPRSIIRPSHGNLSR